MEFFRCYCFNNDGTYSTPKDFDNPTDALTYVSRKISRFPRVLVTDALDQTIYEAVDGKTVFPVNEEKRNENRIKVLVVEPHSIPHIEHIKNSLEAMQSVVGGAIEMVGLAVGETLVCNEEGKLLELKANRRVGNDIIAGPFFIAGDNENGELVSLNDEQIHRYMERFKEPEFYTQSDVEKTIDVNITGFDPSNPSVFDIEALNNKFIKKLNEEVLPYINYEELQKSYTTEEKKYAKEVLKTICNYFITAFGTDSIYDDADEMITLPAIIKGKNTGEICIGLVDIDLGSSGEHWGTTFFTKYGVVQQGNDEAPEQVKQFISNSYMPYDYAYTIGVEHDIHVDFNALPEDMKEILNYCCGEQEQQNGMDMGM